jgi:alginate O-acetyltransferase complex protein AlgI
MTLVGLWHGAWWNFILWGFFHGLYLNLGAWRKQSDLKIPRGLERGLFLVGILLGWALFMSTSTEYLVHLFTQLAGLGGLGSMEMITSLLHDNATLALIFAIPIAFSGLAEAASFEKRVQANRWSLAIFGVLTALCILLIETANSFIYIQF